ncbi:MAG: hypothetical protein WA749_09660, partial [Gelidibacter sp.]
DAAPDRRPPSGRKAQGIQWKRMRWTGIFGERIWKLEPILLYIRVDTCMMYTKVHHVLIIIKYWFA